MLLKLANIRLELGEPEEGLHEKIAVRLGLPADAVAHWRILRKSLDARRHDDIHFNYAAAVDLRRTTRSRCRVLLRLILSHTSPKGSSGLTRVHLPCAIGR